MNNIFTQLWGGIEYASRLAGDLERRLARAPGLDGSQELVSDPTQSLAQHKHSLSISGDVQWGVIVGCIPYTQTYRVAAENGATLIECTQLRDMPTTPLGVADGRTLQPGVSVYYVRHPTSPIGWIIGVEPIFMSDPRRAMGDMISQGSRAGLHVDSGLSFPFQMGPDGSHAGLGDWSGRTPVDSLAIGEFVKVSETGLMLHMDSYMAQFRVDEMTGLFMYYWDQLCRLAGANLQIWSGCGEWESYDDEGEHFYYQGVSGYPWEHRGQLGSPHDISQDNSADYVQFEAPQRARMEPGYDDYQPFHRMRHYGGYVGQGSKRMMVVPDTSSSELRYSIKNSSPCMFEENITFSGHAFTRSATGMTWAKRPAMSAPKRMKVHSDKTGDATEGDSEGSQTYKPSGYYGQGDDTHKLKPQPEMAEGGEHPQFARAAGVLDLHANVFNWEATNAIHNHEKDYELDEEGDTKVGTNQEIPHFNKLREELWGMDPPTPVDVKVDHRDGNTTKVYPNTSFFTLLDDGGIVIGDGYGGEIRMVGGNIYISCPGDIHMESGRNVMSWAGRDIIQRANKSVDITATENDVRVKAEGNLEILGANGGGNKGVIIESRSTGSDFTTTKRGHAANHPGIILRSPKSPIVNWGAGVYLRTGMGKATSSAAPEVQVDPGDIVLDANEGDADVVIHAENVDSFIGTSFAMYYGDGGEIAASHTFLEQGSILAGQIMNTGPIISKGPHVCEGGIQVVGGHIATQDGSPDVGALTSVALQNAIANITTTQNTQNTQNTTGSNEYYSELQVPWYESNKAGNTEIIGQTLASLRHDDDYGTEHYILFESRWAQMAAGKAPGTWTEESVKWRTEDTWPFPGSKIDDEVYFTQPLELHDIEKGVSKDRGELYHEPTYGKPLKKKLNGNYPIVG